MTPEQKARIDSMTHKQLCYHWRFAICGDPLFQGDTGEYFAKVLKEKGNFTPEISKDIDKQKEKEDSENKVATHD